MLIDDEFGYIELGVDNFEDEKELRRFIKTTESIIRRSPEYKLWVNFIKDTKGQNYCYFTNEIGEEVTIDIHHHPYTLYDLVDIAVVNKVERGEKITSYDIAKEVMKLHYEDQVGYIPMIRSLHEKFHNGFLLIPINIVEGNWKSIMETFEIIPEDIKDKVQNYTTIVTSKDGYSWSRDQYFNMGDMVAT